MNQKYLAAALVLLFAFTSLAHALDTSEWYIYSGESSAHTYSLKFPSDWKVKEIGDDFAGFAPQSVNEDLLSVVKEFEGSTYKQAINSYVSDNFQLKSSNDFILSDGDDLVGKRAIYTNQTTNIDYEYGFFKWGSLILSVSAKGDDYDEILAGIHDSVEFDDAWHQYIDYADNYSFIFPSNSSIETFDNGVRIMAENQVDEMIFEVHKYANTDVENAAKLAAGADADLESTEAVNFHGINGAIKATFEDDDTRQLFSKIIVSNGTDSFALTNVNSLDNFPHPNYYDQYISESLESFEFFEASAEIIQGPVTPSGNYKNFSDIDENHPNATAIDSLKEQGVIDGYPDGTFLPDGAINRAEITKLIVATVADPQLNNYNGCFPDVEKQWFAPYVCYAQEQGWVEGYSDGKFRPEEPVNRVEAMKIVLEVLFPDSIKSAKIPKSKSPASDVATDQWYSKYFFFGYSNDLLDLAHTTSQGEVFLFYPSSNMSRKEVAELIYRGLNL